MLQAFIIKLLHEFSRLVAKIVGSVVAGCFINHSQSKSTHTRSQTIGNIRYVTLVDCSHSLFACISLRSTDALIF